MKDLKTYPLKYCISLKERARYKLIKRYNKPLSFHDVKIINDILYDEKTHYVEEFKEYLIYEDYNEFLKRFYTSDEINVKLPKILYFYEKYSKIYANYTVIPESKYMYKNIKRKQKMIDQMQNNDIHNSQFDEYENSNENISNTIFSTKVMNSIYSKTITTLNKSEKHEDLSRNTDEQSINDFLGKITLIENKINMNYLRNKNFNKDNNKNKIQKEAYPIKKLQKDYLFNKNTPKTSRTNHPNKLNLIEKNEILDIQITHSKKFLQNNNSKKKANNKNNININLNNKNNHNNLIFINSYASKSKNNGNLFNNNRSTGNSANNNTYNNNNNTFNGQKNVLKSNMNFHRQKLPTALLKQSIIKSSKKLYKENMNLTNINNYFTNVININNDQKYKLSLGENLLKFDKIVLSTNTSSSPKFMNENMLFSGNNKSNIFQNKKNIQIKEKENEKEKIKKVYKKNNQPLSSNKPIYNKNIKTNLFSEYNSYENNLTFLSHKYFENPKISTKLNKKVIHKKIIENDNNKIFKKPESHRNNYHSKIISGNHSNIKNKMNNKNKINSLNKNYKIAVGLKHEPKNSSQKIISTPNSPNNSSSNFYFQSHAHTRKNSFNNLDKKIIKISNENNKKKVLKNFNIVNKVNNNSTQIGIHAVSDVYKSLHYQNNKSGFNSSNITPGNTSSKSPKKGKIEINGKNKIISKQQNLMNNKNNVYIKSNIELKEKNNLDLKKIFHKQIYENDKDNISERQINNRKLFEKLGKYFFNKNENKSHNLNYNYISGNITNSNIKSNNSSKRKKNIKNKKNNEYERLINKIIKKNYNLSKGLENKTKNDTPIKNKYGIYIAKNNKKIYNKSKSPFFNEQLKKMNKASSKQNINHNKIIINNLNDLMYFGDDASKFIIYSERNKNSKIDFQ